MAHISRNQKRRGRSDGHALGTQAVLEGGTSPCSRVGTQAVPDDGTR